MSIEAFATPNYDVPTAEELRDAAYAYIASQIEYAIARGVTPNYGEINADLMAMFDVTVVTRAWDKIHENSKEAA